MNQTKIDRFLFRWYHGPVLSYLMDLSFESMGWRTTFGESEFLKWEHPDLDVRRTHDFRPDYEATSQEGFFACEIKVGYTRKRKAILSERDKHIQQFKREAENTVTWAKRFSLRPIFSLALGCNISERLSADIRKICDNFIFIHFIPSTQDSETSHPRIHGTMGYAIPGLVENFNSISKRVWPKFEGYNRSMKKLSASRDYSSPRSAAQDFIIKVFQANPDHVKLQNLFSSLYVGRSLEKW